jgi:hypothetical protein
LNGAAYSLATYGDFATPVLALRARRSAGGDPLASFVQRGGVRSNDWLGIVCTMQWILSEPLHQVRHHLLKAGRHVDANEPAFVLSVILEVMRHSAWDQDVASTLSVSLLAINN